jgi:predicted DsbA family dithiol-disulfide isomerase
MLKTRKDVSVAFRHFPMNKDCNPSITTTLHSNACWAARAAEAAAILRGEDGFWQMHRWLFENRGRFEDKTLPPVLQSMGYDVKQFIDVMSSEETLRRVQEDCADARWLGLHYTPMVFINGVELKGVFTPGAVSRAVELLAAKNPPVMGCELDDPVPASEKYVADWRDQSVRSLPPSPKSWPLGPDDARLQVVAWGDLQEPNTARVDQLIRKFIAGRTDARYEFRHYPINMTCNPYTQVDRFPKSCIAHKAVIAAGLLGGSDGYWRMQEWLTTNREIVEEARVRQIAPTMGLDAEKLAQLMESDDVARLLTQDAATGRAVNLSAVPTVYINGKFVPRWLREGESVLERIMTEALGR